ncbi:pre-mRNA-splicing factor CLF1, putative [Plasmodium berghei]|uniref:Pre-mRNA-splicing factor CLF1, putative n=2 Tax=Plasmodium berghei TaxID=5821 RepID=A0A509AMT4_PLABA|nr:pre-mRNA-splicing factor CLF1, putative [Plasmodium berghei ANKA]CXI48699.1 pre-mRNA-splicing factor CLF1, putative [Plasmodium berghei]SCL93843.1 pre-mRNA-splicing factor CLF1, putative [Plasmodium berghei]SCM15889.1 pre-mRNA-splicing factor CLF1, putative [Plasmodium berghei]SCM17685.1 pre-mRNA-splicing factor CLF1, putative [Plasmodium berghei]SCN25835.1 pre-mRNA-splicing factor CLF1, putative [Plasmodium berghei]|eukprot:XP_034421814.1 pre-mRNA-splicing factor CLF1, putative [Plasmodium berghei ANKA]
MYTNSKNIQVKNKNAADVQITAEQLIKEALDFEEVEKKVNYNLIDEDELNEYKISKRKEFEDSIRKRRYLINTYIKYALWEIKQKDIKRCRSVFERALNIDYTNKNLWLKYIEVELTNKNINSARNLLERVVLLLPLENIFWKKYAHLEEILNNFVNARNIYERWVKWKIDETAFLCYINFEERCKEINKCREIFEQLIVNIPKLECFYRFIKFEKKYKNISRARACYEKCIELLPSQFLDQHFYIHFSKFEEENNEYERCRKIYIEALKRLPRENSDILYKNFLQFQKKYSEKEELDQTLLYNERIHFEEALKKTPNDYDIWFNYIKLEEQNINLINKEKSIIRIRELYERAISIIPQIFTKKYWKRYIYLWINYSVFEELYADNIDRARQVYSNIFKILSKQNFTFKKMYILYANFEIRQMGIDKARAIFNHAIENVKNEKIFQEYCDMELRLGNVKECRTIYSKYVEAFPFNSKAWIAMINFELSLDEIERARQIAEIAIHIDDMKLPELIWKAYIDLEINLQEYENASKLYERLLNITQHYKVYKSYAEFQYVYLDNINKCREILENGIEFCKKNELTNERSILLSFLYEIEKDHGDNEIIEKTLERLPKKVKKKKIIKSNDDEVVEEFITYVFLDDKTQSQNMKILQKAMEWKKKMEQHEKEKVENEQKNDKEMSQEI